MKLDLHTYTSLVDDAISFVFHKCKENLKPPSSSSDKDQNESKDQNDPNGPGYNEDKDHLGEEQEEQTG